MRLPAPGRRTPALLPVLALLLACPQTADRDGDGYADELDCASDNASIHPGASDPWGDCVDSG